MVTLADESQLVKQENLGSNEMLLYVAVEPEDEAAEVAEQPPVASLRKKHSIGKGTTLQVSVL